MKNVKMTEMIATFQRDSHVNILVSARSKILLSPSRRAAAYFKTGIATMHALAQIFATSVAQRAAVGVGFRVWDAFKPRQKKEMFKGRRYGSAPASSRIKSVILISAFATTPACRLAAPTPSLLKASYPKRFQRLRTCAPHLGYSQRSR